MVKQAQIIRLDKEADVATERFGARANRLAKLRGLGLPVPLALARRVDRPPQPGSSHRRLGLRVPYRSLLLQP